MTLQDWMKSNNLKDSGVAALEGVKISRSQVSRVRRFGTESMKTAQMLAAVTGLPLEAFVRGDRK